MSKKKELKIMRAFEIGEISAVDVPAQSGALMRIVKRADGDVNMEKLDTGALVKRYIDPMEGAVPFSTALAAEMRCQDYYEAIEDVCPVIYSMETSLKSIAGDSAVAPETKLTMMRNTVEDFMSVIRQMWSSADVVMMSALGKSKEEVDDMVKKALTTEQMQAQIADLEKKLEDITKASADASVAADLAKQVEELTAKVGELTTSLEDETAKASMSDAEKEYMRGLGADAQRAFRGMSAAERKKKIGKSSDEETITFKGRTIRKSAENADMFEMMKAQNEEIELAQKAAAEERDARQMSQYEKVAADSYTNLPGTPLEKAKVLKGIETLDESVQTTIVKMLTAGEGAIKAAFNRVGSGGDDIHRHSGLRKNGAHPFMTKVNEIKKRDNLGHAAALTKARQEFPAEFEEYRNSDNV